jgi:hypothetical protein
MNAFRVLNTTSSQTIAVVLAEGWDAALEAAAKHAGVGAHIDVENADGDVDFVADFIIDGIKKNKEYNSGSYDGWDASTAREIYCDFSAFDAFDPNEEKNLMIALLAEPGFESAVDARVTEWLNDAIREEAEEAE